MIAAPSPLLVGIDVAARMLDCSWPGGEYARLPNSPAGWQKLIGRSPGAVIVLEATGVYYYGLAVAAYTAGLGVRVVNPWQVRSFASSRLSRTKTDKVDAALIREFGERMFPDLAVWYPPPEGLLRVASLVRLGDGLVRHRVAAGNRVHALRHIDEFVATAAEDIASVLRAERVRVMRLALIGCEEDELLSVWLKQLQTLPGFGEIASLRLLAYAGDLRRFGSARKFAAYAGLTPRFKHSGEVKTPGAMSRIGSGPLRGVLYMAAISAGKSHSEHGEMYRRLVAKGKPKKVALVALANRLARAAWTVCIQP